MSSLRSALRQVFRAYFYLQARTIAFIFPARLWYAVSYRICFLQGQLLSLLLAFTSLRNKYTRRAIVTRLTQSALPRLVAISRPFPIPFCEKNAEAILEPRKTPQGVVLCSVHLPLITLAHVPQARTAAARQSL